MPYIHRAVPKIYMAPRAEKKPPFSSYQILLCVFLVTLGAYKVQRTPNHFRLV